MCLLCFLHSHKLFLDVIVAEEAEREVNHVWADNLEDKLLNATLQHFQQSARKDMRVSRIFIVFPIFLLLMCLEKCILWW